MMNTLRSTERSLTLLNFTRKAAIGQTLARGSNNSQYKTASSNFSNGTTNKRPSYKYTSFFKTPRIKLYKSNLKQPQPRFLSTFATADVSLTNPNKAGPDEVKELVVSPIVPLTLSRFPRNTVSDIPSVTKVLQATMPASSKFLLDKWKEAMVKKLGIAGFNKYQAETFERGRALHALLANYLLGLGEPADGGAELSKEIVSNLWKSIQKVVQNNITNVRLVEHIVTHSEMKYRGIVDCVAFYKNELVVIDFKTAEKPKKSVESLFDNPIQVTAYCGALNSDSSIPKHVIDRNISSGLVIVAYVDGSEASTYYLGQEQTKNYWKQWINRLDQFNRMEEMMKPDQTKNVSKPK